MTKCYFNLMNNLEKKKFKLYPFIKNILFFVVSVFIFESP